MSKSEQFHFLNFDPSRNTKKDRELKDSQARAHAAHVSHVRRRTQTPFVLSFPKGVKQEPPHRHNRSKDESAEEVRVGRRRASAASIVTRVNFSNSLQKGNTDPFNAFAIALTAEKNEVISFYNNNVLPLLINYMEASGVGATTGRANWHDPFSDLREECNAYGLLSRTAVIMARTPDASKRVVIQASTYKGKLLKLLRTHMVPGEARKATPQVYQCIVSLLITAVFENALSDAAIHLSILRSLLLKQSETSLVDANLLFTILWYDFQWASKALTRPAFDFKGWTAVQFRPNWEKALLDWPILSGRASTGLNWQFKDDTIKELFIRMRELLEITQLFAQGARKFSPSTPVALEQRALMYQGQIIDVYVDALAGGSEQWSARNEAVDGNENEWGCYTKAYVCLAALWWTRRLKKEENVPTKAASTIFNASATILPALRSALVQSEVCFQEADSVRNGEVRLWALFVGTVAEQLKLSEPTVAYGDDWFLKHFRVQVQGLNLRSWAAVQQVLEGFLYSDRPEVNLPQSLSNEFG